MESKQLDESASSHPNSKILFVSQESSADIAQEAFRSGALGYVAKTDAGRELSDRCEHCSSGRGIHEQQNRGMQIDEMHSVQLNVTLSCFF